MGTDLSEVARLKFPEENYSRLKPAGGRLGARRPDPHRDALTRVVSRVLKKVVIKTLVGTVAGALV